MTNLAHLVISGSDSIFNLHTCVSALLVQGAVAACWRCTSAVHVQEAKQKCLLCRIMSLASEMCTRYYALITGGRLGIKGLAELYNADSVSACWLRVSMTFIPMLIS